MPKSYGFFSKTRHYNKMTKKFNKWCKKNKHKWIIFNNMKRCSICGFQKISYNNQNPEIKYTNSLKKHKIS